MDVARIAVNNLRDARHLGPSFLMRHVNTRAHRSLTHSTLKGVGPITIRNDSSDAAVFRQVFSSHEYELAGFPQYASIRTFLDAIVDEGNTPLIIDLGANVGASPLWFGSRFAECHVVAVEPDPSNVAMCRENVGHVPNVELLEMAIGSKPGTVVLVEDDRGKWGITTVRSEDGPVRVCTIDEIVRSRSDFRLFLVKIDIEGFEGDLFGANTDWVSSAKVIIIEPHDWMLPHAATSRNFQRVMGALDFDLLLSGENLIYIRREPSA